jgi:phosphoribosylformylglycinamidine synthase
MKHVGRVTVRLKGGVLDVEGKAIEGALASLGFGGVAGVRVGKVFEVALEADTAEAARAQLDEMADKLLANPVMERYEVEVQGAGQ